MVYSTINKRTSKDTSCFKVKLVFKNTINSRYFSHSKKRGYSVNRVQGWMRYDKIVDHNTLETMNEESSPIRIE